MKRILLLIYTILIVQFSHAQKLITFGPMVGLTGSTLENSDFSNNKAGGGYVLGGFIRADIKKWYVQPNIYYMNSTSSFDVNQITIDSKQSSINGDLLLGYRLFKFTDLTYIRLFAGPTYSNINTFDYNTGNPDYATDNFLLNVGAGIDVWKFTFDLKYQRGLTDIDKSANNMHTNVLMLTAGFKIF